MKIILFSRPQTCRTVEEPERLFDAIERHGFDYAINAEFAEAVERLTGRHIPQDKIYGERTGRQPSESVMVCYGGDGTLLEGIHRLDGETIPVTGINSGHLGFLALAPKEDTDDIFRQIGEGRLVTERRPMLEVSGIPECGVPYALNEVAVQRLGATMVSIEAQVDGQTVATYNGSGLIISTPTGSTAYSLSAGGPILAPACNCLVLTPLAPHNLPMRPLVIPDSCEILLKINPRHRAVTVSLDNRTYETDRPAEIAVRRSERSIFLAVPHNISFYDTLRNKMMWGVDIRK